MVPSGAPRRDRASHSASGELRGVIHRSDDPAMPLDAAAAARKLKLAAARSPAIVNATDEDREALAAAFGSPIPGTGSGDHDWILVYARDRAALEASVPGVAAALASPG